MGLNLTYKILKEHLVEGSLSAGQEIAVRIDQTLTQDATGTMSYLQFETMGVDRAKTEISVSYVDHNTLGQGFENADDHKYLQTVAAKYGIYFSRPGNGICHQVHLERFAASGKTLLGSDSHTPTCGAAGMIAIGAGGLDVACALAGKPFYLIVPYVVNVALSGKLSKWVTAKDVILHILSLISTKGNVNKVLEYSGDGLKDLTVPERATIANMGAETGVTTSIFPCDDITKKFFQAQERPQDFKELSADKDAVYDKVIKIDLSQIKPLAAAPHSPGNVVEVQSIAGKNVDQVAIGSCTNSSLKDLMTVAAILKGKKVNPETSLIISPGSKQVFSMLAKSGALADLIDTGARIMESTCGFCIGAGQAPASKAVSVRTSNRNFETRSGTKDASIYLVSPQIAALAAMAGKFVDPIALKLTHPKISLPEKFVIDDSMVIAPVKDTSLIKIIRGPNIGQPPKNSKLDSELKGVILIKVGDKITTDHIMPAGPRLKFRSNIQKYAEFVFELIDSEFPKRAIEAKAAAQAVFIAAGK